MNTVYFDELNSFDDFSLYLISKTIGTPSPKTQTVDIPAGDGVIDYTEYFGDIKYSNRTLTFEFATKAKASDFVGQFTNIQNALHGHKMKIRLSEEPDVYYYGRVTVSAWKSNEKIGKITVDVDCDPWKYKNSITIYQINVSNSGNYIIRNGRRSVSPDITVSANMALTFEGGTYNLVPNMIYNDNNITFRSGNNQISIAGSGTITFTWQEGNL